MGPDRRPGAEQGTPAQIGQVVPLLNLLLLLLMLLRLLLGFAGEQ